MYAPRAVLGALIFTTLICSSCDPQGTSKPSTAEPTVEEQYITRVQEIEAGGYAVDDIMAWAERVEQANAYVLIESREAWPNFWPVADAMFAKALELHTDPEDQLTIYRALFRIEATAGNDGSDVLRKALEVQPDLVIWREMFRNNSSMNKSAGARVDVCVGLRPLVDSDPEFDSEYFFKTCYDWADEDPAKLWPGAAEEYANREMLIERLKQFHTELAIFFPGGGRCQTHDGGCSDFGWSSRGGGDIDSTCISEDCIGVGWVSNTPEQTINTRCNNKSCQLKGWKSKGDSETWTATCKGTCKEGWTLKGKKQRYEVTCRGSNCFEDGYDVVTKEGWKFACYCNTGSCLLRGTYCKALP
ncbi:MAG: hypothetical protein HC927_02020 [Deltaproteobacteria bacterium]|nr:hypothetical protein [Deltaproteobacteria bacterium]